MTIKLYAIQSITKKTSTVLLLIFLLSTYGSLFAQNYPVTCTPIVKPSFSLKWSEISTSSEMFKVHLLLKDLTKPSVDVYLKIRLSGVGVDIHTVDGFIPSQTIHLNPGSATLLTSADLAEYFNISNLVVDGIDISALYAGGRLPEGLYTWTVEAYEIDRHRQVSNTGMALMNVFKNYPPIINIPQEGAILPVTNPQNILFSWTSRSTASLNAAQGKTYKLRIYPLNTGEDPNMVANSGIQPIEITTTNPYFNYGAANIALEKGKRYAVQVQESDINGFDVYENEGKSQVVNFSFGKPCVAPEGLTINPIEKGRVELTWEQNDETSTTVWYKQSQSNIWNHLTVDGKSTVISNLKDKTAYEFKVSSNCGANTNAFGTLDSSNPVSPSSDPIEFIINDSIFDEDIKELDPAILDPYSIKVELLSDGTSIKPKSVADIFEKIIKPKCANNANSYEECSPAHPTVLIPEGDDLETLAVGDVLGIYDYAVLVTEVSYINAFSGKGLVKLPFLDGAFMAVEFSGIKIKKGEDGTHGGCVYQVSDAGYFRNRNISQSELQNEQVKTIADIIKLTDPTIFHGDLEATLLKYKEKGKEITTNGTATPQVKQDLLTYTKGIETAVGTWKDKFTETFSNDSNPKLAEIMDDMKAIISQLKADKQTIENGNSYPIIVDLNEKIDVIIEKIKALQEGQKPILPKIQNVIVPIVSHHDATITWQGDPKFTKYVFSYKTADGGELIETANSNRLSLKNLQENSHYGFKIEGYVGDNLVDTYKMGSFNTLEDKILPPTNVVTTIDGMNQVTLTWEKEADRTYFIVLKDKDGKKHTYYTLTNTIKLGVLDPSVIYTYSIVASSTITKKSSEPATGIIDFRCNSFVLKTSAISVELGKSVTLTASGCPDDNVVWGNPLDKNDKPVTGKKNTVTPTTETTYNAFCLGDSPCIKSITISVTSADCSDINFKINEPVYEYGSFDFVKLTTSGCEGGTIYWATNPKGEKPEYNWQTNIVEIQGVCFGPKFYAKCVKTVNGVEKTCYDAYQLKPCDKDCKFEAFEISSNSKKIIKGTSLPLSIVGCSNGTIKWEHNGQDNRQVVVSPSEKINYAATCTPNDSKCNTVRAVITIDVIELDCNKFVISPYNEIFENTNPVTLKVSECLGKLTWSNGETGTNISVIPSTETKTYNVICKIDENRQCLASSTVTFVPPNCNNFIVESSQDAYNNVVLAASGCSGDISWDKGAGIGATVKLKVNQTTTYTATCSSTKCANAVTVFIAPPTLSCPVFSVSPTLSTVSKYDRVSLSANGCTGTLKWGTGEITNTITVSVSEEKTYKATCTTDGFVNIQCAIVRPSFDTNANPCSSDFKIIASDSYYTSSDRNAIALSTQGSCSGTVSFSSGSSTIRPQMSGSYYAICDKGNGYCISGSIPITVLTCKVQDSSTNFDAYFDENSNLDPYKKTVIVKNCVGIVKWNGEVKGNALSTFEITVPKETGEYSVDCDRPSCFRLLEVRGYCEDFRAYLEIIGEPAGTQTSQSKTAFRNKLNQIKTIITEGCASDNLSWKDKAGNIITAGSTITDDFVYAVCKVNNTDCIKKVDLTTPTSSNARVSISTPNTQVNNATTYTAIIADKTVATECTTCNSCNIALNKGMTVFLQSLVSDIITQTTVGKDVSGNYTTSSVKEFLKLLIATLKSNPKLSGLSFPTDLTPLAQGFVNDKNIENLVKQLTASISENVCITDFNFNILPTYSTVANTLLPLAIPPLTLTATTTNASCGLDNGSVKLSATGGTPPYQYSKDGITYQSSDTFDNLVAGIYTFTVKENTGNTTTTKTTVNKETDNEVERTTYEPPPLGNARLGGEPLIVRWDATTTAYTFTPKAGVTITRTSNGKVQLTTANLEDKQWEGEYGVYFKVNDHNSFIGFYKEGASPCSPSGFTKDCKLMCKEGFLPQELLGLSLRLLVTDEEVGYTLIRVFDYGTTITKVTSLATLFTNPIQPAYPAKVYKCTLALFKNNVISEKLYSFSVTRDAWQWAGDINDNQLYILNRAFEPDGQIDFDGVDYIFPHEAFGHIQIPAFKLYLNNSVTLPAKPLERTTLYNSSELIGEYRNNPNEATNVMVHIGGHYTRGFMDWLGGSLGCFGFVESKDVKKSESEAIIAHEKDIFDDNMSNSEWQSAVDTIHEYEKKYLLKLKITVFPRENYLKSFNLNKDKILWE